MTSGQPSVSRKAARVTLLLAPSWCLGLPERSRPGQEPPRSLLVTLSEPHEGGVGGDRDHSSMPQVAEGKRQPVGLWELPPTLGKLIPGVYLQLWECVFRLTHLRLPRGAES